jgi:arylsulfatase A-like enzyme
LVAHCTGRGSLTSDEKEKEEMVKSICLIAFFILLSMTSVSSASTRPNILLILTDDMGYADATGTTEIPVPNLQRLADGGVRCTEAYVTAPVCVPSRMGLLSGCHQQRFGIYGNVYGAEVNEMALAHTLLPRVMQKGGYRTILIGKWHQSGNSREVFQYGHPVDRGFDEMVAVPRGGTYMPGITYYRTSEPLKTTKYVTDFWGDEACSFIDRNKEKPFFLYLAFNAVHAAMEALEEDIVVLPGDQRKGRMREIYTGMMTAMDRNVGRVLDSLEENGLTENTIVIFLNDNGGGGHTEVYGEHSRNYADNSPYRGYKNDLYEGGIRTPFYIKWPGRVKAGSTFSGKVSSMDVFPTIVAATGLHMPLQPCDGKNLMPYFEGSATGEPHESLFWESKNWTRPGLPNAFENRKHNAAVRKGPWKLIRLAHSIDAATPPPRWALYDLSNDVSEQNDLAAQHPEIVESLGRVFNEWQMTMEPSREPKKRRAK